VNIYEVPEAAEQFSVMSIPTFIVVHNGVETTRKTGAGPLADLIAMVA
jgi:thioredoxin-like negative regulator of GroEL